MPGMTVKISERGQSAVGHQDDLEFQQTVADASSSLARSPEERIALFLEFQRLIEAAWDAVGLTEQERRARLRRTSALEPRPEPWWRDVKREGLP